MRMPALLFLVVGILALAGCPAGDYSGDFGKPPGSMALGPPTLSVNVGTSPPPDATVSNSKTGVSIIQLSLQTGASEKVRVTSIEFTFNGTGNVTALNCMSLYVDADHNGFFSPFFDTLIVNTNSPTASIVFSGLNHVIEKDTQEDLILVFDFNGNDTGNNTFSADFAGASAISAEGVDSGLPADITATAVNGRTVTTEVIGSLTLGAGSNNPGPASILGIETNHLMLHMTLTVGSTEDVTITEARITDAGNCTLSADVTGMMLVRDDNKNGIFEAGTDTVLGTVAPSSNIVVFPMSETILASDDASWLVLYNFGGVSSVGTTYQASLQQNTHLIATGDTTSKTIVPGCVPVMGGLQSVPPGTLSVAMGANTPPSATVAPPVNQSLLQITLTTGPTEPVDIQSITFTEVGGGVPTNITSAHLLDDIGATPGQYDSVGDVGIVWNQAFTGNTVTFTPNPVATIPAGSTANWILVYNFGGGTGSYSATHDPALQITAVGKQSSQPMNPTGTSFQGNVITLSGGAGGMNWSQLSSTGGPGGRIYGSAVYDGGSTRVLFFGGSTSNMGSGGGTNTLHALAVGSVGGEAWTALSPGGTAPIPRWAHHAVFDSTNSRMIVYGGVDNSTTPNPLGATLGDVHVLTLGGAPSWSPFITTGTAPTRYIAAVVLDTVGNQLLVFGGADTNGQQYNGTHVLNLATNTWTAPATTGTPSARGGCVGMYHSTSNMMIVFGGSFTTSTLPPTTTYYNDTWQLNVSTWQWTQLTTANSPSVRAEMAFGYDSTAGRFYIFGGTNPTTTLNDTWYFDVGAQNWIMVSASGSTPTIRQGAAGAFATGTTRLVIHGGGVLLTAVYNDTYYLR